MAIVDDKNDDIIIGTASMRAPSAAGELIMQPVTGPRHSPDLRDVITVIDVTMNTADRAKPAGNGRRGELLGWGALR